MIPSCRICGGKSGDPNQRTDFPCVNCWEIEHRLGGLNAKAVEVFYRILYPTTITFDTERSRLFGVGYMDLQAPDCVISLEPRPVYCDRGRWIAHIFITGDPLKINLDAADLFPRAFFSFLCAKLEMEEWLRRRGQTPFGEWKWKAVGSYTLQGKNG